MLGSLCMASSRLLAWAATVSQDTATAADHSTLRMPTVGKSEGLPSGSSAAKLVKSNSVTNSGVVKLDKSGIAAAPEAGSKPSRKQDGRAVRQRYLRAHKGPDCIPWLQSAARASLMISKKFVHRVQRKREVT